jgi:hypothetical protein
VSTCSTGVSWGICPNYASHFSLQHPATNNGQRHLDWVPLCSFSSHLFLYLIVTR